MALRPLRAKGGGPTALPTAPDVPGTVATRHLAGRVRRHGGFLIDVCAGLAAALGQAPWGLWPLSLLGLAVVVWRVGDAATGRRAFWRALAAGAGYFGLAMLWIIEPFLVEPEIYGWMAPFALVLMALGGALFWAIPSWAAWRLAGGARDRALAVAAALALSDWIRGWLFTGLPWALTGHVWIDTPAGQAAAWIGAVGLSALTMAAAALPAWAARDRRLSTAIARGLPLSAALVGAAWFAGLARLNAPMPPDAGPVIRLVQPNADQTRKWDPEWAPVFYDRLLQLSAAPAGHRVSAVVWPETAAPFLLDQAPELLHAITSAAGAPVLAGIQRGEGGLWFNSLAEFTGDARLGQVYDKFHLVPFGEYIPWGDLMARFGVSAFAAQQGFGYAAGPGARVMTLAGLPPVMPLICYEAVFSRHLRQAGVRPAWLLQVTNDAWFGSFSGPYQHLAQARLRAIESGLPLMRAANTGVSAAIDARGTVRRQLALNEAGFLDAALPGALPPTLWWRLGDWPAVAAILAALAWLGARRRRPRDRAAQPTVDPAVRLP